MMLCGPKKDEATVKAFEALATEENAARAAQVAAEKGTISKEEANAIIRDFNEKFLAMGGMKSFCKVEA